MKGCGPRKLRGLLAIYRVLYQTQGCGETLPFGGKHCPLWGVGESWKEPGLKEDRAAPPAQGFSGMVLKARLTTTRDRNLQFRPAVYTGLFVCVCVHFFRGEILPICAKAF